MSAEESHKTCCFIDIEVVLAYCEQMESGDVQRGRELGWGFSVDRLLCNIQVQGIEALKICADKLFYYIH